MECPKCGLLNTERALKCDCGFVFATGNVEKRAEQASKPFWNQPIRLSRLILATMLLVFGIAYTQIGLFMVQPIGAVPDGATVVVWRGGNQPFFDSADAACLRAQGGVSLLCRGIAFAAIRDRILLRLPYLEAAYLWSTDGRTFESSPQVGQGSE